MLLILNAAQSLGQMRKKSLIVNLTHHIHESSAESVANRQQAIVKITLQRMDREKKEKREQIDNVAI